jgi:3-hydroxyisobutyrate dehydrogenase-like beta-hydroxyacid dehydrogenase
MNITLTLTLTSIYTVTIMTNTTPSTTVLGLGPMGRAVSAALISAGIHTTIWNRTAGKGETLVSAGATEMASAPEAIAASDVVIASLVDYDAVRSVVQDDDIKWGNRVLVNLTSGTPAEAAGFAHWAAERDIRYLDGAILTPVTSMGTSGGVVLFSGSVDEFEALSPIRSALGETTVHLGEVIGLANAFDVALLDIFATAVHGIVHGFALARAQGISPSAYARFAAGIGSMLPGMITGFAEQLELDDYPGERSTIASAAAGIRHIIETASASELDTGALEAMQRTIDRAILDGAGDSGLARLSRYL